MNKLVLFPTANRVTKPKQNRLQRKPSRISIETTLTTNFNPKRKGKANTHLNRPSPSSIFFFKHFDRVTTITGRSTDNRTRHRHTDCSRISGANEQMEANSGRTSCFRGQRDGVELGRGRSHNGKTFRVLRTGSFLRTICTGTGRRGRFVWSTASGWSKFLTMMMVFRWTKRFRRFRGTGSKSGWIFNESVC